MQNFSRIAFAPQVMGGKPRIREMRVTVGAVVGRGNSRLGRLMTQ